MVAFRLCLLEIESGSLITPNDDDIDAEFKHVTPYFTL